MINNVGEGEAWNDGHNSAVLAMQDQLEDAVQVEREECAKVLDDLGYPELADRIRERSAGDDDVKMVRRPICARCGKRMTPRPVLSGTSPICLKCAGVVK